MASLPAREHILYIAGGVLCRLLQGKELVEKYGTRPADLAKVEAQIRNEMLAGCVNFLNALSVDEQARMELNFLPLLRGDVPWSVVKGLYDDGLVARVDDTLFVKPVSLVAASVFHAALAANVR